MGVPPNGWFKMENIIRMDDLGYPYFRNPPHGELTTKTKTWDFHGFTTGEQVVEPTQRDLAIAITNKRVSQETMGLDGM